MKKRHMSMYLMIILVLALLSTGCGTIFGQSAPAKSAKLQAPKPQPPKPLEFRDVAMNTTQKMRTMPGYQYEYSQVIKYSLEKKPPSYKPIEGNFTSKAEIRNSPFEFHSVAQGTSSTTSKIVRTETYSLDDKFYEKEGHGSWKVVSEGDSDYYYSPERYFNILDFASGNISPGENPKGVQLRKEGDTYILTIDFNVWEKGSFHREGEIEDISRSIRSYLKILHPHTDQTEAVSMVQTYWIDATSFQLKRIQSDEKFKTPVTLGKFLYIEESYDYTITGEFNTPIQVPSEIKK